MNNILNIFKLLSDETRFRIIMLIANEALCVCQINGILEVSQPKVSKGLSKLRDMGLVEDYRVDKFVYYKLKEHALLNSIIKEIKSNYSNEILNNDLLRLKDKESYLTSCTTSPVTL